MRAAKKSLLHVVPPEDGNNESYALDFAAGVVRRNNDSTVLARYNAGISVVSEKVSFTDAASPDVAKKAALVERFKADCGSPAGAGGSAAT